ncbi:MAG: hypothetical protein K2O32_05600 [Acetatifactor sp.]|nr:hypothetical protein [Acetatifactor sp.]
MKPFDKTYADTLCTIIACGFMSLAGNQTTFIYETVPKEDTTRMTGEKAAEYQKRVDKMNQDISRHEDLARRLSGIVPQVRFKPQQAKKEFPFIFAKSDYLPDSVAEGLVGELQATVDCLERSVNKLPSELPGAYIGGLSTISSLELCGGSDLYQYAPEYRTDAQTMHSTLSDSYNKAVDVSNTLANALENFRYPTKGIHWGAMPMKYVAKGCDEGKIFASVHGMTRSINYYHANSDKSKVYLELALGRGTCKVASCIPCSIFMFANGHPATATHMGRGDNWNLPEGLRKALYENSTQYVMVNVWRQVVNDCYAEGIKLLAGNPFVEDWKKEYTDHSWAGQIPKLFLEALTYESSFMDKMCGVLPPKN